MKENQLFFKDALARFITTIIAGKVRLAFPVLHAIDPVGTGNGSVALTVVTACDVIRGECGGGEARILRGRTSGA